MDQNSGAPLRETIFCGFTILFTFRRKAGNSLVDLNGDFIGQEDIFPLQLLP